MKRAQVIIAAAGMLLWTVLLIAGSPRLLCAVGITASAFALTEALTRGRRS